MKDSIVQVKLVIGYLHTKKARAATTWLLNKLHTDFGGCTWSPYGKVPPLGIPDYMFNGWGLDKNGLPVKDRVLIVYVDMLGDIDDGTLDEYFSKLKNDCEKKFEQFSIWIIFTKGKILEGPGIAKKWTGS